ncbi:hypothetical protein KCV87_29450 [Actinosynnema pretiosum subsp. pretiosum]|uniref:Uncharacterized protein n=1 Tax=Actinosynnema pretiosum subsp. pretiosum TaxID=103721 RepID=A0AA45L621_9PSEU|nr:Basic proline-rich protein [Actinosynnema pretiosum subsp. pretiosum]QUF03490.1 hypothetical protein KCV87_29450 [Actinosynnema pretiosum subsp. pretiosum]
MSEFPEAGDESAPPHPAAPQPAEAGPAGAVVPEQPVVVARIPGMSPVYAQVPEYLQAQADQARAAQAAAQAQAAAFPAGPQQGDAQQGQFPQAGFPQAGAPQSGPQSALPQAGFPQTGFPRTGPQSALPTAGFPQSGPQSALPQAGFPPPGSSAPGWGTPAQGFPQPGAYPAHPAPQPAPFRTGRVLTAVLGGVLALVLVALGGLWAAGYPLVRDPQSRAQATATPLDPTDVPLDSEESPLDYKSPHGEQRNAAMPEECDLSDATLKRARTSNRYESEEFFGFAFCSYGTISTIDGSVRRDLYVSVYEAEDDVELEEWYDDDVYDWGSVRQVQGLGERAKLLAQPAESDSVMGVQLKVVSGSTVYEIGYAGFETDSFLSPEIPDELSEEIATVVARELLGR